MEKWEKSKGKLQNSLMENEQKLIKLTKDVFHQEKICCPHNQLFISITGPEVYGRRFIPIFLVKLNFYPGYQLSWPLSYQLLVH